jgi:hypothetical protein
MRRQGRARLFRREESFVQRPVGQTSVIPEANGLLKVAAGMPYGIWDRRGCNTVSKISD